MRDAIPNSARKHVAPQMCSQSNTQYPVLQESCFHQCGRDSQGHKIHARVCHFGFKTSLHLLLLCIILPLGATTSHWLGTSSVSRDPTAVLSCTCLSFLQTFHELIPSCMTKGTMSFVLGTSRHTALKHRIQLCTVISALHKGLLQKSP